MTPRGEHRKFRKTGYTKRSAYRRIYGVTPLCHRNAPDPGLIVTGVHGMPRPSEINLEPRAEIHRIWIHGHANIAQIACTIPRRNVHTATERNGEVGEVSTNTRPFLVRIPSRTVRSSVRIAEVNSVTRVLKNSLHPRPTFPISPEQGPCQAVQLLGFAIPASEEKNQYVIGQLADGMLAFI